MSKKHIKTLPPDDLEAAARAVLKAQNALRESVNRLVKAERRRWELHLPGLREQVRLRQRALYRAWDGLQGLREEADDPRGCGEK